MELLFASFLVIVLSLILFWTAKIFYIVQKSLNEIIKGLNSVENRLCKIEAEADRLHQQDKR
ncbi:hypothetical protein N9B21_01475 [Verrucomicrobiales bacterium]|jgi:hypothetical protein|nr:hypothetical protein [Verrucomicrobiales bacterium]MDA7926688.1 hypothetical protein [Verrucomicrobiales bacterium]|tara:strand:- start:684 stop:869 length:186 start_codon:yes stop_codon:yes gene_type:complete